MNMSAGRTVELQQVFTCAERAMGDAPSRPAGSEALARLVFRALGVPPAASGNRAETGTAGLPACEFLPAAVQAARGRGGAVAALAEAVNALAPMLRWERRPGTEREPGGFFDGHANAVLAGPRGLEVRNDVLVGLSLMAPGIRYPDHHHPPEEFYVVLSPGEWRQADGPWHEPGPGGVVYNPHGIVHAMRSGAAPLLALWFLWTA